MHSYRHLSLAMLLTLLAAPASAYSLDDVTSAVSAASGGSSGSAAGTQSLALVQSLSSLGLTSQQALGGTGAMLELARNRLPGNQFSQLTQSVPGLDQLVGSQGLGQLSGLGSLLGDSAAQPLSSQTSAALSNVTDRQGLDQAFSALGMDSGMVGQFAPLLLQYFGTEGVDPALLDSLGSLWGAGGA